MSSRQATSLVVRVTPRAARDEILGVDGAGVLRLRVAAPPVDGRANASVARLVASELDLPVSAVEIVQGGAGRRKRLLLHGVTAERLRARWPGIST